MTIDEYLAQLEELLPSTRRRRFLAEAEAHLRDAARSNRERGLDAGAAERTAVESFGDVRVVAQRIATESAPIAVRRATGVALAAILALVLPVYGIPENTLPPAPWATKPSEIAVLQGVTVACWLLAITLGCVAVALALVRRSSAASAVLLAATLVVGGLFVSSIALFAVWLGEAPGTPLWPFLALALPVAAVCLLACAGAFAWARARSRPLRLMLD